MDERVVTQVKGDEIFPCMVSNPITDLIVTSCDEASVLEIQVVTNGKLGVAAVVVRWEF